MFINVFLPRDRTRPGYLHLFDSDGERLLAEVPCRGKADNQQAAKNGNPTRNPTRPYGDTPAGVYMPSRVTRYDPPHKTFGKYAILLEGEAGDALKARENGRSGLAIHGGRGDGRLIATYGCIRVRDSDMQRLVDAIGDRQVIVEVVDT